MAASARLVGLLAGKRTACGISSDHLAELAVPTFCGLPPLPEAPPPSLCVSVEETKVDTDCKRRSSSLSKGARWDEETEDCRTDAGRACAMAAVAPPQRPPIKAPGAGLGGWGGWPASYAPP
mmetsp:Transcript_57419/g.178025  ORF Transcript_57419/g.178025 Transcript_57419/m.178025 type:complete len:122 (+) Transcript_57419:835-1200(+)